MTQLTDEEKLILILLSDSYNQFIDLEPQNHIDLKEFAFHIHALQNILASRVAARADPNVWKESNYHEGREADNLKEEDRRNKLALQHLIVRG